MSLDLAGGIIGVTATAVAFWWLLGQPALEQLQEAWTRWRTPIAVCRGCGQPIPVPQAFRCAGVPFCSADCALAHPLHTPEEYQP